MKRGCDDSGVRSALADEVPPDSEAAAARATSAAAVGNPERLRPLGHADRLSQEERSKKK